MRDTPTRLISTEHDLGNSTNLTYYGVAETRDCFKYASPVRWKAARWQSESKQRHRDQVVLRRHSNFESINRVSYAFIECEKDRRPQGVRLILVPYHQWSVALRWSHLRQALTAVRHAGCRRCYRRAIASKYPQCQVFSRWFSKVHSVTRKDQVILQSSRFYIVLKPLS